MKLRNSVILMIIAILVAMAAMPVFAASSAGNRKKASPKVKTSLNGGIALEFYQAPPGKDEPLIKIDANKPVQPNKELKVVAVSVDKKQPLPSDLSISITLYKLGKFSRGVKGGDCAICFQEFKVSKIENNETHYVLNRGYYVIVVKFTKDKKVFNNGQFIGAY